MTMKRLTFLKNINSIAVVLHLFPIYKIWVTILNDVALDLIDHFTLEVGQVFAG